MDYKKPKNNFKDVHPILGFKSLKKHVHKNKLFIKDACSPPWEMNIYTIFMLMMNACLTTTVCMVLSEYMFLLVLKQTHTTTSFFTSLVLHESDFLLLCVII